MKNVLITGGAGFLGSHLCDKLLFEGYRVFCIDNLSTGSVCNISHLMGTKNFLFKEHDIVEPLLSINDSLDYIIHLASPASPLDYLRLPIETLKAGSFGTYNILQLAKDCKAKFLLASTSECYGDPKVHPQPETYWGNVNPIGPRSVYDEAKRFSEALTMAYYREYGINTSIARIFNTYGPRMKISDGRALPTFIYQVLQGKDLTIFGDGSQTRSFCYVSDMVEGLYKLLLSKETLPVNLGNPNEITILELATKICNLIDCECNLKFNAIPEDDPKVRRPVIVKAKDVLSWEPKVSLDQGLKHTLQYFKGIV